MTILFPSKYKYRIPSLFPMRSHLVDFSKTITMPAIEELFPPTITSASINVPIFGSVADAIFTRTTSDFYIRMNVQGS